MRDRPAGGRKRLRLPEYNYSTPGAYFFTIVTISRQHLFGCIANDSMVLNDAGAAVTGAWRELPDRFPELELDEFVVMPNHVHGITWLTEHALHLGKVMRALKSLSAREVKPCVGSRRARVAAELSRARDSERGRVAKISRIHR